MEQDMLQQLDRQLVLTSIILRKVHKLTQGPNRAEYRRIHSRDVSLVKQDWVRYRRDV